MCKPIECRGVVGSPLSATAFDRGGVRPRGPVIAKLSVKNNGDCSKFSGRTLFRKLLLILRNDSANNTTGVK